MVAQAGSLILVCKALLAGHEPSEQNLADCMERALEISRASVIQAMCWVAGHGCNNFMPQMRSRLLWPGRILPFCKSRVQTEMWHALIQHMLEHCNSQL